MRLLFILDARRAEALIVTDRLRIFRTFPIRLIALFSLFCMGFSSALSFSSSCLLLAAALGSILSYSFVMDVDPMP